MLSSYQSRPEEDKTLFSAIREDYLYNFSLFLNRPLIGPEMLQVILTTRCNLKCKMCDVWKQGEEEINAYYVKRAIDGAVKLGNLKEVYFTGGEALLRDDIFSLIKYVKDYYPEVRTHINTNGTLLTPLVFERLLNAGLDTLGISIDSPLEKIHNYLRGEGVFKKALGAINYVAESVTRRHLNRPQLVTLSVLMSYTLEHMPQMVDFCLRHNIVGLNIQPYVFNGDLRSRGNDEFWIKPKQLPTLRRVIEEIDRKRKKIRDDVLHIAIEPEKIYNYFSRPVYIDKCYAGFTRALLVGKKICFVCNGPNDRIRQHFGEADKNSLFEVWDSDEAGYFRNTIKHCRRNCAQFCAIRPSSDSLSVIHRRLLVYRNLDLLRKERDLLSYYQKLYPSLPLAKIIEEDDYILKGYLPVNTATEKDNLEEEISYISDINSTQRQISVSEDVICQVKRNLASSDLVPYYIDIVLNNYCNLGCRYCSSRNITGGQSMQRQVWVKILREAKHMGVREISLTSFVGEPLVFKDITAIMKEIKFAGFRGSLLTNGSRLDEKFADFMLNIGWDILIVSVDSFNEEIQYKLRPSKNGIMYMKGLKRFFEYLSRQDKKINLNLNMVVNKLNYREVKSYIEQAELYGVSNITFLKLTPMNEEFDNLKLDNIEERKFVELLKNTDASIRYNWQEWFPVAKDVNAQGENKEEHFCYFHLYKLIVNWDGEIIKCNGDNVKTGLNVLGANLHQSYITLANKYRHLRKDPPCWELCCSPIKRINQDIHLSINNVKC